MRHMPRLIAHCMFIARCIVARTAVVACCCARFECILFFRIRRRTCRTRADMKTRRTAPSRNSGGSRNVIRMSTDTREREEEGDKQRRKKVRTRKRTPGTRFSACCCVLCVTVAGMRGRIFCGNTDDANEL